MKIKELRLKSIVELKEELINNVEKKLKLRLQKKNDEVKTPHIFKLVRRDIARIKTLLTEKTKNDKI